VNYLYLIADSPASLGKEDAPHRDEGALTADEDGLPRSWYMPYNDKERQRENVRLPTSFPRIQAALLGKRTTGPFAQY
jgi:hypothetical protein